jgi:hypothetical protein
MNLIKKDQIRLTAPPQGHLQRMTLALHWILKKFFVKTEMVTNLAMKKRRD